jgi:uncharacterized small protein (DUF1192 family)
MSLFEDDRPKKKTSHEIGADLSMLDIDELKLRVGILKAEIERLEAEITSKSSSRNVAEGLFRK